MGFAYAAAEVIRAQCSGFTAFSDGDAKKKFLEEFMISHVNMHGTAKLIMTLHRPLVED